MGPCPGTLTLEPPGLALLWSLTACPLPIPAGGSCQGGGDEVTARPAGDEVLQDIQVMLKSDASPSSIRSLKVGPLEGGVGGGCAGGFWRET